MTDNEQIKKDYGIEGATLKSVGFKHGISAERVRQIVNPKEYQYCEEHDHKYENRCLYHDLDQVYNREIPMPELMETINRLKAPDRSKPTVYEKKLIINYLRNHFRLTPGFIGTLFDQDITTIKHHLGIK